MGFEDSLGRSFGDNLNINDLVKGMLSPVKKGGEGAENLQKLAEQNKAQAEKRHKEITKLLEGLPDKFKKKIEEVFNKQEKIRFKTERAKNNRGGKGGGATASAQGIEAAVSRELRKVIPKEATQGMAKLNKKGSAFVRDETAHNLLKQILDSLQKGGGADRAGAAAPRLRGTLFSSLEKQVGLASALLDVIEEVNDAEERRLQIGDKSFNISQQQYEAFEDLEDVLRQASNAEKRRLGRLSRSVYLALQQEDLTEAQLEDVSEYLNLVEELNYRYGESEDSLISMRKIWTEIAGTTEDAVETQNKIAKTIGKGVMRLGGGIAALSGWESLTKGVISNYITMNSEMRVHAFQTGKSREELMGLTHLSGVAAETGQRLSKYQESYNKALKSGYKDLKKASKITKAGLALATATGMEAADTADHMTRVSQQLNLSNLEAAQFARHIQFAAQATGVTGENLTQAMKAAESIQRSLRDIGSLSGVAAGNVTQMTAALQKYGIADELNPIMKALTGGTNFFEAAPETIAALTQAADLAGIDLADIISGEVFKDKKKMGRLFEEGFGELFKEITGGRALKELSPEERAHAALVAKGRTGLPIGVLERLIEAGAEGARTLSEQMTIYRKELEGTLSTQERQAKQAQLNALQFQASTDILTEFGTQLKESGGDVSTAFNKFRPSESLKESMKALGIGEDVSNRQKILQATEEAVKSVNAQLKAVGKETLDIDEIRNAVMQGGKQSLDALDKLNEAQRTATTAAQAQKDPMVEANQQLVEINNFLQNTFGSWAGKFLDTIGGLGIILSNILLAIVSSGGLGTLSNIARGVSGRARGMIGNFLGGVGPGAGGAAGRGGIRGMMSGLGGRAGAAIGAVRGRAGAAIGGRFAGIAGKLGGLGGAAAKAAGPIGLFITALLALPSAFKSAAKAAEIFGVKQEEVTAGQKTAAGISGFLVGILKGLNDILSFVTFGLVDFSSWLAPDGPLVKGLAKLVYIFSPLVHIIEVASAVFKGLKEGLTEVWKELKDAWDEAMEPIWKELSTAWVELKEAFVPLAEALGMNTEEGFEFATILKFVAKAVKHTVIMLKPLFKLMGTVAAGVIGTFVKVLVKLVDTVKWAVSIIADAVKTINPSEWSWVKNVKSAMWGEEVGKAVKKGAKKASTAASYEAIKEQIKIAQRVGGYTGAQITAMNLQTQGKNIGALRKAFGKEAYSRTMLAGGTAAGAAEATVNRNIVQVGPGGGGVEPVSHTRTGDNLHKQIRREMVDSKPDAGDQATTNQLDDVIKQLASSNAISKNQESLLRDILSALKGVGEQEGPGAGDTRSKLTYRVPAQYYRWLNRYSDNAQSNVSIPTIA